MKTKKKQGYYEMPVSRRKLLSAEEKMKALGYIPGAFAFEIVDTRSFTGDTFTNKKKRKQY